MRAPWAVALPVVAGTVILMIPRELWSQIDWEGDSGSPSLQNSIFSAALWTPKAALQLLFFRILAARARERKGILRPGAWMFTTRGEFHFLQIILLALLTCGALAGAALWATDPPTWGIEDPRDSGWPFIISVTGCGVIFVLYYAWAGAILHGRGGKSWIEFFRTVILPSTEASLFAFLTSTLGIIAMTTILLFAIGKRDSWSAWIGIFFIQIPGAMADLSFASALAAKREPEIDRAAIEAFQ